MARRKTIEAGAVNIRAHPNDDPNVYMRLVTAAFELKRPIRVRGDQHLILSYLEDNSEDDVVRGTIARFTDINMTLPWIDLASLDRAGDADMKAINIPDGLRPNRTAFYFAFHLRKHLMVIETRSGISSLSIRLATSFLNTLLNAPELVEIFGVPSVTLKCKHESLDRIWEMHRLRTLSILIQKPNPDSIGLQQKFQDRMVAQNTQSIEINQTVVPGKSIEPDDETIGAAEVAISNGKVLAEGQNEDGSTAKYSSNDHPHIERLKYDPDSISPSQAFMRSAKRFFR